MKQLCECRCAESKGEYCCGVCDKCGSVIKYTIVNCENLDEENKNGKLL